ncbi:hypothetical protein GIS00_02430 [Nakamurella sp. YIM 132087]|uniref:Septum formation-related domain-containing protein n=1 Tax=Nakamurella alba TaxID=2665158 RepID=A0A7K1FFA6_9ACTN|nr:hypothetical protein [Nakamurella alba]MTD12801.1 hypothetical protein [Nakamurella alba]
MRRQLSGAALLLVAVLAVLGGMAVLGRRIQGDPATAPIPGPPALGSCLRTDVIPAGIPLDDLDGLLDYRSAEFETCAGRRAGEVVALITDPAPVDVAPVVDINGDLVGRSISDDPNYLMCISAARGYLGLVRPEEAVDAWIPLSPFISGLELIGPTPLQRRFGQQWVVCVVFDETSASDRRRPGFAGTVKDAYLGFPVPAVLTACDLGPCDILHRDELLASATFISPRTAAQVKESCREHAQVRTGLADLTAVAGLSVVVKYSAAGLAGAAPDRPLTASCLLRADEGRWLDGSLLNVGRADRIPWA